MEKTFRLNDEDMHKPLTMEQMTQMFSQEDKDAVYAINQELHKEKYNAHLKKDWRKLVDKKWREEGIWQGSSSDTTEKDVEVDKSVDSIDLEDNQEHFPISDEEIEQITDYSKVLAKLYAQYGSNSIELDRLNHEQDVILHEIENIKAKANKLQS